VTSASSAIKGVPEHPCWRRREPANEKLTLRAGGLPPSCLAERTIRPRRKRPGAGAPLQYLDDEREHRIRARSSDGSGAGMSAARQKRDGVDQATASPEVSAESRTVIRSVRAFSHS
jgi:hypothetical protein